jgi:ribokinase
MNTPTVTVVGSFNFDLVVRTPRIPAPGETILGGPFYMGPGGKGANQAVAAARLGARVNMVVKLGMDTFGDIAAQSMKDEGINPEFILRTDETHTGTGTIVLDADGENMIVVAPGANMLLQPSDVDKASAAIAQSSILLVQLEVPMVTVRHAVDRARGAGVQVLLNPAPGRVLADDLLARIDVLTPNETEAQIITGLPVGSVEEAERAAIDLLTRGVGAVVVTLGAQGAMIADESGPRHAPGISVNVVDTTGAGDAFSGALAVALAEGADLDAAVQFANVAAALQVARMGTAPAMPYRAEVEEALSAGSWNRETA